MLFGGVIHISPLQSFGSQFSVESAVGIEGKTHLSGFDTHFAQLLIEFGFGGLIRFVESLLVAAAIAIGAGAALVVPRLLFGV